MKATIKFNGQEKEVELTDEQRLIIGKKLSLIDKEDAQ